MFDNSLNQKDVDDDDDKEETTRSKQGKQKPTTTTTEMADVLLTKHAFWVHRRRWDLLKRWCVVYCRRTSEGCAYCASFLSFVKFFFYGSRYSNGNKCETFRFRVWEPISLLTHILPEIQKPVVSFVAVRFGLCLHPIFLLQEDSDKIYRFPVGISACAVDHGLQALEYRRGNMK